MGTSMAVMSPERTATDNPALPSIAVLGHLQSAPARTGKMILFLIGFSLTAAFAMPTRAQSLAEVESALYKKEQFFQPVNTQAPKFALQDADGRPWDLDALKGKVVVLQFVYASCKDVCPLLSDLMAHLQEMTNHTPMQDRVQFISITTDPARDTPDVLKAYGPVHGLDRKNWVFLTTRPGQPDDATRQLADRFGLKFTKTDDGEFVHGAVTNIIDRDGVLRAKFHGLHFDPTNLIGFVNFLGNYVPKPGDANEIAAMSAGLPTGLASASDLKRWIPIGLLMLAAAWLVVAVSFFRLRRRRSATGVGERPREHDDASTPAATNDSRAATRI